MYIFVIAAHNTITVHFLLYFVHGEHFIHTKHEHKLWLSITKYLYCHRKRLIVIKIWGLVYSAIYSDPQAHSIKILVGHYISLYRYDHSNILGDIQRYNTC